MTLDNEKVFAALAAVIDPELRLPITELGMVGEVSISDGSVSAEIKLTVVGCPAAERIKADTEQALSGVAGGRAVDVELTVMTQAERDALKERLRGGRAPRANPFDSQSLTRILLIGSGKGGVGKSSVTANLAVALAAAGHRVGLIDADIFGFSIPGQLGIQDKPTRLDDMILPPVAFGVKVISIGMFLDDNKPVAWRGPMLHRAISQFLTDVFWGDLDFLLVDLPPGTGDVAISLGQLLPTAKSVVVTTPQQAAAEVAERSGAVGLQTGQPIAGVIENMSWLIDSAGNKVEIFGSGGAQTVADRLTDASGSQVEVLGQIPLSIPLRECSDAGTPLVATHSADPAAVAIFEIAQKLGSAPMGLSGRRLKLGL